MSVFDERDAFRKVLSLIVNTRMTAKQITLIARKALVDTAPMTPRPPDPELVKCGVTAGMLPHETVHGAVLRVVAERDALKIALAECGADALLRRVATPTEGGFTASAGGVCPSCENMRYIQDAGFVCCSVCNPDNSFYR